jgi:hypothetical protein
MEGSGRAFSYDWSFYLEGLGKIMKMLVGIVGDPAEIRTEYLPNISQKLWRLNQLFQFDWFVISCGIIELLNLVRCGGRESRNRGTRSDRSENICSDVISNKRHTK